MKLDTGISLKFTCWIVTSKSCHWRDLTASPLVLLTGASLASDVDSGRRLDQTKFDQLGLWIAGIYLTTKSFDYNQTHFFCFYEIQLGAKFIRNGTVLLETQVERKLENILLRWFCHFHFGSRDVLFRTLHNVILLLPDGMAAIPGGYWMRIIGSCLLFYIHNGYYVDSFIMMYWGLKHNPQNVPRIAPDSRKWITLSQFLTLG